MLSNIAYLLIFLTVVTMLVAAHEYGHYLLARLFRMDVEEFAIGFGSKPFTWMRKRYRSESGGDSPDGMAITNFTVRPLPLGGFVKIKGMVPQEDGTEVEIAGGFYSKPPWQRFLVLLAGPVFSMIAGLAVLIPLFMISGVDVPLDAPTIGMVAPGSPADKAGLKEGDTFVSVGGKAIATWKDVLFAVREQPDRAVDMEIERGGRILRIQAVPKGELAPVLDRNLKDTGERRLQGKLGIGPATKRVPQTLAEASYQAVMRPVVLVAGVAQLFKKPDRIKEEVGGPIAIFQATRQTAERGFGELLAFAATLSIWLGIFNLFPIPPLDGGQMAVALAEMARGGRRLSLRVQSWVQGAGIVLLGLLVISVFAIDIGRLLPK
jgi:regulator of sigma E protease